MKHVRATALLAFCAAALGACGRDDVAPTDMENHQMDDASNLLDAAPDTLDRIDERLPSNETGPPAEANDP